MFFNRIIREELNSSIITMEIWIVMINNLYQGLVTVLMLYKQNVAVFSIDTALWARMLRVRDTVSKFPIKFTDTKLRVRAGIWSLAIRLKNNSSFLLGYAPYPSPREQTEGWFQPNCTLRTYILSSSSPMGPVLDIFLRCKNGNAWNPPLLLHECPSLRREQLLGNQRGWPSSRNSN